MSPRGTPNSEEIARVALFEPDGVEQWMRWMHSRCDPERGIHCPWCVEFNDEETT